MSVRILVGDCRASLASLPPESVQTCVTSPPYWGLRDYGVAGQLGLEETPEAYVAALVDVFRAVRRVLRDDGTLWLNLGDSYAANRSYQVPDSKHVDVGNSRASSVPPGLKPKDLVGIPWRVAFALQADGWWLRSDIVWAKPNPMPESVTDRPTKAHEYVFLLAKSERYFYDAAAISEPADPANWRDNPTVRVTPTGQTPQGKLDARRGEIRPETRNARTVWPITTQPFSGAHFATMPPALAERCILAGCPEGVANVVLDPFGGAGTTGLVAQRLGRSAVLCELNAEYARMAEERIREDAPMFAAVDVEEGASR